MDPIASAAVSAAGRIGAAAVGGAARRTRRRRRLDLSAVTTPLGAKSHVELEMSLRQSASGEVRITAITPMIEVNIDDCAEPDFVACPFLARTATATISELVVRPDMPAKWECQLTHVDLLKRARELHRKRQQEVFGARLESDRLERSRQPGSWHMALARVIRALEREGAVRLRFQVKTAVDGVQYTPKLWVPEYTYTERLKVLRDKDGCQ